MFKQPLELQAYFKTALHSNFETGEILSHEGKANSLQFHFLKLKPKNSALKERETNAGVSEAMW